MGNNGWTQYGGFAADAQHLCEQKMGDRLKAREKLL